MAVMILFVFISAQVLNNMLISKGLSILKKELLRFLSLCN